MRIRLSLLALLFALLFPGAGQAQQSMYICIYVSGGLSNCSQVSATNPFPVTGTVTQGPYAYTPLTPAQNNLAITSSTALTIPAGATYAVVCASGANVNFEVDGTTTPTASVGMPLLQSQCVSLSGATVISNFRAIQKSATATLDVSYYK